MWNKLVKIIKQPSTKKLGLALLVSVMLHGFLVGNSYFQIPQLTKERFLIEAKLIQPKPEQPKIDEAINQPIQKQAPSAQPIEKKPEIVPKQAEPATNDNDLTNGKVENEQLDTSQLEPPQDVTETIPAKAEQPAIDNNAEVTAAENKLPEITTTEDVLPELEPEPKTEDAGLIVNENAYTFVETDFKVYTEINGSPQGKAKITYTLDNNKEYELKSKIEPTGLASLVISDLLQTSVGTVTQHGLQPINYLYQYGNKIDKTYIANFDWLAKKVVLTTAKGNKTENIVDGTQDLLSFMYQFMHVAPLQNMQITIATGKKLSVYDYSFVGEETLTTTIGELKTMHIVHAGLNSDEKTELWLALDHQYVPVKIRKTEKNGKLYELIATAINTRPNPN